MAIKRIIETPLAPAPIGPYSQAVLVGDTLYVSGQIALNPSSGSMEQKNIEMETEMVMQHLGNILKAAGMDYRHVVKCSIFLKNFDDFGVVNAIYGRFFSESPPARETVEVSRLPKDARVEISCIACR
jgi:2-iminobutanoate/2-iminopropanoate deaminase